MMIGRLDDWLKVVAKRDHIDCPTEVIDWAGIACAKRAYTLFKERSYRTKLLVAAYRHLGHWSELIGGEIVQTMPWEWQVKANQSGRRPIATMDIAVEPGVIATLEATFADFRRAYEPNGMTVAEFDTFGPVQRTLRSFIAAWYEFVGVVRNVIVPDPDV
jgi:transaldolase